MANILALQMLESSDPLGFGDIEGCRSSDSCVCVSWNSCVEFIGDE